MTSQASLPMYDFPELRDITDAWWQAIARGLSAEGIDTVPAQLERDRSVAELWTSDALLLSQTCGYPFSTRYCDNLQPLLTPCYRAPGSAGPTYSSLVIVAHDDPARALEDLAGSSFAVNGFDSWSGWHGLRRELGSRGHDPDVFLSDARPSGAHRSSIQAVAQGQCRACAVDAVTHTLLARHAPSAVDGTKVLFSTAPAPALLYVTTASASAQQVACLRAGLRRALVDPSAASVRDALIIGGADELSASDYRFMSEVT